MLTQISVQTVNVSGFCDHFMQYFKYKNLYLHFVSLQILVISLLLFIERTKLVLEIPSVEIDSKIPSH